MFGILRIILVQGLIKNNKMISVHQFIMNNLQLYNAYLGPPFSGNHFLAECALAENIHPFPGNHFLAKALDTKTKQQCMHVFLLCVFFTHANANTAIRASEVAGTCRRPTQEKSKNNVDELLRPPRFVANLLSPACTSLSGNRSLVLGPWLRQSPFN